MGKGNNANAQTCTKPATELTPVKNIDVRGEMVAVGGIKRPDSRVITGKVTDKDENPVSFASIKIKGTSTGVFADANGTYSMKVNSNDILVISGASFKDAEVLTGTQLVFNSVLEKASSGLIEVVTLGGAIWRNVDEYYGPLDKLKRVAVLQIKDETTGKPIPNANLIVKPNYSDNADTVIADKKGMYKIKGITDYDEYEIKVSASGYEPSEFTIEENDFNDRKKTWEVLLRKQKSAFGMRIGTTAQDIKGDIQIHVVGQTRIAPVSTDSLYIIDELISTKKIAESLSPDDISDIKQLKQSEATALYGSQASNGAIVIKTRKSKEIKLKEVVVNSEFGTRRVTMGAMTGGVSYTKEGFYLDEKITIVKTFLTDSIKIYPNPVQRNSDFSVQLKLKQPGNNYSIFITDAAGRILLQQKFNASTKDHTEKIISDSRWAGGIYYIRVFDAQNKLINKSSFIVR